MSTHCQWTKTKNCFLTLYHIESCAQAMQKVMTKPLLPLQKAMKDRLKKKKECTKESVTL